MGLGIATTAAITSMSAAALLGQLIPPLGRFSEHALNNAWRNAKLMPLDALDLMFKHREYESDGRDALHSQGFSDITIDHLKLSKEVLVAAFELTTLYRRKEISDVEFYDRMNALKIDRANTDLIFKATEFFPSPGDLVRFAVREVYNPLIRNAFGMDENISQKYLDEAEKAGMTVEQATNFWAAHWELPSIGMLFEMLHRSVIDDETLQLGLQALDVMPFWRDKLTKISYVPYTRVDVRRMYSVGVLDVEDVYRSYLDIGYNPEKAQKMTEFTIRYENDEFDGISRSNIVKAFKRDLISEPEMREMLKNIGMSDNAVNFWVEQALYEEMEEDLNELEDYLLDSYKLGTISKEDIESLLVEEQLPESYKTKILSKLRKTNNITRKRLPLTRYEKAFQDNIITVETFLTNIISLGYVGEDFNIIAKSNGVKEEVLIEYFQNRG